nr:hypothetical protein [Tanacetum cinerariifolium]
MIVYFLYDSCLHKFPTSFCIALFLSSACPFFFCLTGEHPSGMFSGVTQYVLGRWSYPQAFRNKYPSYARVDHTTCCGLLRFLTLGLSIIPLYEDGDLNTTKFIQAEAKCSSCPILTSSCIFPIGHIISPLNPIKGVVAGINWFLISGRSRLKQCLYSISKADPPSTYMRCMQWPSIYASMIIGPSVPSSSSREWKTSAGFGILFSGNFASGYPLTVSMVETISFTRDSRLPLPPEEGCGQSYHFINGF